MLTASIPYSREKPLYFVESQLPTMSDRLLTLPFQGGRHDGFVLHLRIQGRKDRVISWRRHLARQPSVQKSSTLRPGRLASSQRLKERWLFPDEQPAMSPSRLRSSYRAVQRILWPSPVNSQLPRSSGVARTSLKYQSSGTERVRPSGNSTCSVSTPPPRQVSVLQSWTKLTPRLHQQSMVLLN